MLGRDADSLAVALLARAAGVKRVMVRMRDKAYRQVLSLGRRRSPALGDRRLDRRARYRHRARGRVTPCCSATRPSAVRDRDPQASPVAGRLVSDLATDPAFPRSCVFAAPPRRRTGRSRGRAALRSWPAARRVLLVARRAELGRTIDFFMGAPSAGRASG